MTTTQLSANKTPFSISDILTDLKVNGRHSSHPQREDSKSDESDSVARFQGHEEAPSSVQMNKMLYGINSVRDTEGFSSEVASAMRKRMDEKRGSGSFVRRGSLECFLIDNKGHNGQFGDRRDSFYPVSQKPLDMRRSGGSISDNYDSGTNYVTNGFYCVGQDNSILVPSVTIELKVLHVLNWENILTNKRFSKLFRNHRLRIDESLPWFINCDGESRIGQIYT